MNKKKIFRSFEKAAHSYDQVATVQQQSAEKLAFFLKKNLPFFYPQSVLDLGAGTGIMAEVLQKYFVSFRSYVLNDCSDSMLNQAKKKLSHHPYFSFCTGDMDHLILRPTDLTVANLSLQWSLSPAHLLRRLLRFSKVCLFSYPVWPTFSSWYALLKQEGVIQQAPSYPSSRQLQSLWHLSSLNYQKQCQFSSFTLHFPSRRHTLQYLKNLGVTPIRKSCSIGALKHFLESDEQPCSLHYRIAYVLVYQ